MTKRPLSFTDPGRYEIYSHHSLPTLYGEETHDTMQICIPFQGASYHVIRQSEIGTTLAQRLGAKDVLVVPATQPHVVEWRRPADILSLQISARFISEALGVSDLQIRDTLTIRDPFLSAAAAQIKTVLSNNIEAPPALMSAFTTLVAYRVMKSADRAVAIKEMKQTAPLSAGQSLRIDRFIADHLDKPISLAVLAELVDLSIWHFTRRFYATEGMPPYAFITQRRLRHAKALLAGTAMPIIDVALAVGMSHSHFSRVFLKHFEITPSEYRRQKKS